VETSRELTGREKEALAEFRRLAAEGMPPSITEVGEAMRLPSPNNAVRYLDALVDPLGLLRKVGTGSRRYRLRFSEPVGIPELGDVAAGCPLVVTEAAVDEWLDLAKLFHRPGYFALKVRGDSMTGLGVMPGDRLILKPVAEAQDGERCVFRVNGGYTYKTFRKKGRKVWLEPANPAYGLIVPGDDDVPIGVEVGVVRWRRK
jgi:repressor LexA